MPSAKMFLGNKASRNEDVVATMKAATKYVIIAIDQKDVGSKSEPALCIQVKGFDHWIRVNKLSIPGMIKKYGDDTDQWIGKQVTLSFGDVIMMGQPKKQVNVNPV